MGSGGWKGGRPGVPGGDGFRPPRLFGEPGVFAPNVVLRAVSDVSYAVGKGVLILPSCLAGGDNTFNEVRGISLGVDGDRGRGCRGGRAKGRMAAIEGAETGDVEDRVEARHRWRKFETEGRAGVVDGEDFERSEELGCEFGGEGEVKVVSGE